RRPRWHRGRQRRGYPLPGRRVHPGHRVGDFGGPRRGDHGHRRRLVRAGRIHRSDDETPGPARAADRIGGKLHSLRQAGIGIATQDGVDTSEGFPINVRTTDTTIAMASSSKKEPPLLTGVAFRDANGDGRYEPGEGLGGVTIAISRGPTTTTMEAGGYSI